MPRRVKPCSRGQISEPDLPFPPTTAPKAAEAEEGDAEIQAAFLALCPHHGQLEGEASHKDQPQARLIFGSSKPQVHPWTGPAELGEGISTFSN